MNKVTEMHKCTNASEYSGAFMSEACGGRESGCWSAVLDTKTSPYDGDRGLQVARGFDHDYIPHTYEHTLTFEQRKHMICNSGWWKSTPQL